MGSAFLNEGRDYFEEEKLAMKKLKFEEESYGSSVM
jgi:hypothetical protein